MRTAQVLKRMKRLQQSGIQKLLNLVMPKLCVILGYAMNMALA